MNAIQSLSAAVLIAALPMTAPSAHAAHANIRSEMNDARREVRTEMAKARAELETGNLSSAMACISARAASARTAMGWRKPKSARRATS